jgi:uncharacterized protein with ParB-like and HNH nuclease domain
MFAESYNNQKNVLIMEKENLASLFEKGKAIKVPSYQRAYSWKEEQLEPFVKDLIEFTDPTCKKNSYYFGHFILLHANNAYEIIDGQQRITTFILFLMVCKRYLDDLDKINSRKYLDSFETVDYDQRLLASFKENIDKTNWDRNLTYFNDNKNIQATQSSKNIVFALNYFSRAFENNKSNLRLDRQKILDYICVIESAHVSIHITENNDVAVQIFEMHNTRGVKLNLLEKVKAKLMKAVFIHAGPENSETQINKIQDDFKEIYHREELISSNFFRGELSLDELLLLHLRIVDDGNKLKPEDKNKFSFPGKSENRENAVINYIDEQIANREKEEVIKYVVNLSSRFKESVLFFCDCLPTLDEKNTLIGDTLILSRDISIEFFLLLIHSENKNELDNKEVVQLWETFLFTRDFHDKYFNLQYRDDFDTFYIEILKSKDIVNTLRNYVDKGFRPEKMDDGSLPKTVKRFIFKNETSILSNAFHWWSDKMVYTLYKYEIKNNADLVQLRSIMKQGRSVEHILPQDWQPSLREILTFNDSSPEFEDFKKIMQNVINGIGNLLLISSSENSSLKNKHPMNKKYGSCEGGSYDWHNHGYKRWEDHTKWNEIINERGKLIFDFLSAFVEGNNI